jgi:hypothetical protein
MTSKTDICNLALIKIGKARVQDIDTDESQQATDLKLVYDSALLEILAEAEWSFAVFRQALNKSVETPLYEWSYKFQIPTYPKYIRLISIENDPAYSIEGDFIFCNQSSINILYIGLVADPNLYTIPFQNAFVLLLAYKICYNLTNSSSREKELYAEYREKLAYAVNLYKALNAESAITDNTWATTRTTGG